MPENVASKKKQRRCVACGASADKRSLHRIVRSKDGHVAFDPTGRAADAERTSAPKPAFRLPGLHGNWTGP